MNENVNIIDISEVDFNDKVIEASTNKLVIVDFWAPWCGPCKQEAPAFSAFADAHPTIPVLGLSVDDGPVARVKRVTREWSITYPVAIIDESLQALYDISTLPTTVVVNADGTVGSVHVGLMSESQLARAVR